MLFHNSCLGSYFKFFSCVDVSKDIFIWRNIKIPFTRLRNLMVVQLHNKPSIYLSMMSMTFKSAKTSLFFLTCFHFVVKRMIFFLFPTMTFSTVFLNWTSLIVFRNESSTLPFRTEFTVILKKMRFPSEVLPIMCIYTLGLIVFTSKGAPFCLEIMNVKVFIFFK
jgi:hypothetical protein